MTDDVITRVAQLLYSEIETEHTFVSWGDASVFEAVRFKVIAKTALSALRSGDVLPNGCVVVPDNDWAVVAQFSALSPAKKRAVFAFIEAAKEEG